MSRALFFLAVIAILAICTPSASAQRGWPPGRSPGWPGRPRPGARRCPRPNQVWTNCGTCQRSCRYPTREGRVCAAVCYVGCECAGGFVRSNHGQCIRPWQCPLRRG